MHGATRGTAGFSLATLRRNLADLDDRLAEQVRGDAFRTADRYKISLPPTTISVVAKIGRSTASGTCAEM
jgi:hypothetical protein